jgi:hypothetical protein
MNAQSGSGISSGHSHQVAPVVRDHERGFVAENQALLELPNV